MVSDTDDAADSVRVEYLVWFLPPDLVSRDASNHWKLSVLATH